MTSDPPLHVSGYFFALVAVAFFVRVRRHRVQMRVRTSLIVRHWRFTPNRRFVLIFEWLRRWPDFAPRLQILHRLDIRLELIVESR